MIQTQYIPQSKPNQQNNGILYINHEIKAVMTLDDLSKLIIHLTQIYRYAVNNNIQSILLRK